MFNPPGPFGPQNMPAHIKAESAEAEFLNLFLDNEFWDNLTNQTNNSTIIATMFFNKYAF